MTADDLKVQKGLAMVELEEAEKASVAVESEFSNVVKSLREAADLLNRIFNRDEAALRAALLPYSSLINIENVVFAWSKRIRAIKTLESAKEKLAVFRG